jgi:ABC-type transport system involved in cytochrome bd biosynthesis fused ATPase/permease subunit
METSRISTCRWQAGHLVGGTIQVYLVFVFLSIFFFLYVIKKEKEIFVSQIQFVVDSFVKNAVEFINVAYPDDKSSLKDLVNKALEGFDIEVDEEANAKITEANNRIRNQTALILLVIGVVLAVVFVVMWKAGACFSFGHQLVMSLIMLAFIAMTEFAFLNLVAKNHIAAEVNKIKISVLDQIQKYAESKITSPVSK